MRETGASNDKRTRLSAIRVRFQGGFLCKFAEKDLSFPARPADCNRYAEDSEIKELELQIQNFQNCFELTFGFHILIFRYSFLDIDIP